MPYSSSHPIGTVKQIADQMRTGYFVSKGTLPRKWNLGSSGDFAKAGTITYSFEPNWYSQYARYDGKYTLDETERDWFRTAFKMFEPLGLRFIEK